MQNSTTEPMDPSKQFCPNSACSARGRIGAGNIGIHSYQPQRSRCRTCKKTFSARRGTMMEGLRTAAELVVIIVILLAYGVDERTVADWQKRAGKHCQQVHHALVEQGKVNTHQVQADEIRAKGRNLVIWMGMAIDASSRLWMAGVVSVRRDRELADPKLNGARRALPSFSCFFVAFFSILSGGLSCRPTSLFPIFLLSGRYLLLLSSLMLV